MNILLRHVKSKISCMDGVSMVGFSAALPGSLDHLSPKLCVLCQTFFGWMRTASSFLCEELSGSAVSSDSTAKS